MKVIACVSCGTPMMFDGKLQVCSHECGLKAAGITEEVYQRILKIKHTED